MSKPDNIDELGAILQKLYDWGYESGMNQASDWAWELKLDPSEHISLDDATQAIEDFYRNKILEARLRDFEELNDIQIHRPMQLGTTIIKRLKDITAQFNTVEDYIDYKRAVKHKGVSLNDLAQFNSKGDNDENRNR